MRREEFIKTTDILVHEKQSTGDARSNSVVRTFGKGNRVLDLGSGSGVVSKQIQNQGNDVFCVELNPRAAQEAKARGMNVKVFDLNDGIPFPDCHFDAIYAGEIFGKIFDTKYLFEECNRVLRSNGFMIFTIVNLNSIKNRVRVLTGKYLEHVGGYPEDHFGDEIRVFNLEKVRELCRTTGFRIEEIRGTLSEDLVKNKVLRTVLEFPLSRYRPQWADELMFKVWRLDI